MLGFRFHPAAVEELLEAAAYIRADDVREADIFQQEFSEALDWARSHPLIFRCFEDDFRKVRVGKFSYSLVFRIRGHEIQILALAHTSRRPGYWKQRTNKR